MTAELLCRRRRARLAAAVAAMALAATACSVSQLGSSPGGTSARTVSASAALVSGVCSGGARVADVGRLSSSAIPEASGIVASRRTADVWWINNDAGNPARLYAVNSSGALLTTLAIDGAQNRDWEDVASGPAATPGGPALLYIGDIGNNQAIKDAAHARRDIRIYRLAEPAVTRTTAVRHASAAALTFRYPDGAHDAEALLVDPANGDLLVITKDWSGKGRSGVYRVAGIATLPHGTTGTLQKVATISLRPGTLVTGADVTRDGRVVALRAYGAVSLYQRPARQPLWAAFASTPCASPSPKEKQAEAIGFAPDGGSLLTTSEGVGAPVHRTTP